MAWSSPARGNLGEKGKTASLFCFGAQTGRFFTGVWGFVGGFGFFPPFPFWVFPFFPPWLFWAAVGPAGGKKKAPGFRWGFGIPPPFELGILGRFWVRLLFNCYWPGFLGEKFRIILFSLFKKNFYWLSIKKKIMKPLNFFILILFPRFLFN